MIVFPFLNKMFVLVLKNCGREGKTMSMWREQRLEILFHFFPSLPHYLSLSVGAAPESSLLIKNLSPAGLHHSLACSGLCATSKFSPFSGVRTTHSVSSFSSHREVISPCCFSFFPLYGFSPSLSLFFTHFIFSLSLFLCLHPQTSDSMLESFSSQKVVEILDAAQNMKVV